MKKVLCMLFLTCAFFNINFIKASDDGFLDVSNEEGFNNCLGSVKMCKLTSDITLSKQTDINGNVIIDLNGNDLVSDPTIEIKSGLISINRGSKLTINDSKGTGKISTGNNEKIYAAINLLKDTNEDKGSAEVIINGGLIEGFYYGIVGNGNRNNTKITINGGTIKGKNTDDSTGIYQPQKGDLIINGGTIIGGTGIEIRSGNLTINDGTIKGTAPFKKMVNGNGTTTDGVGVAVAQHTTKNPIKVIINKGNISGEYAFYEWNPHGNSKDDIDKISLRINGGNFVSKNGIPTIYSEDFTKFVYDGTFSENIDNKYLASSSVSKINEKNVSLETKKKSHVPYAGISALVLGSLVLGGIVYKIKV